MNKTVLVNSFKKRYVSARFGVSHLNFQYLNYKLNENKYFHDCIT